MSKRAKRDLIADHHESMEHLYNPGYWVNRVTSLDIAAWRWARKHNKAHGLYGMFIFGLGVAALVSSAIEKGRASGTSFLQVMLDDFTTFPAVFSALMFLALLYFFLQGPVPPSKSRD